MKYPKSKKVLLLLSYLRVKFDLPTHSRKWIGCRIWVGKWVGYRLIKYLCIKFDIPSTVEKWVERKIWMRK